MSSRPELKLDWATYEAAKYACEHWHYSKSMPAGKSVYVGVWEHGKFIGVVVFARGASNHIGTPYGLNQTQVSELARVALTNHDAPVTRIIKVAILKLCRQSPGIRLLVSYADPAEGHCGGIYQGGNWIYTGKSSPDFALIDANGKRWHSRMVSTSGVKTCFGKKKRVIRPEQGQRIELPGKHRYLMPLDDEMRKQIEPLRKPYPKRPKQAMAADQAEQREGSAHPDAPLTTVDDG